MRICIVSIFSSISLSLSLSVTHTHTQAHTLSLSLSLSLSLLCLPLSLSLSLIVLILSLSLSLSLALSLVYLSSFHRSPSGTLLLLGSFSRIQTQHRYQSQRMRFTPLRLHELRQTVPGSPSWQQSSILLTPSFTPCARRCLPRRGRRYGWMDFHMRVSRLTCGGAIRFSLCPLSMLTLPFLCRC